MYCIVQFFLIDQIFYGWVLQSSPASFVFSDVNEIIHAFFIRNAFSTQPRRCLTFSWIELQMLLRCFLIHLRSFFIRLKFPREQKIPLDFKTEHVLSWHLKTALKKMREKKVENSQLKKLRIWFSRKKIINQSNLSKMQTNTQKNCSRQRENSFSSTQWG